MFSMKRNRSQDSCGSNWSVSSRERDDKMSDNDMDIDNGNNDDERHLQTEHELFLQAFEKPTQIYRYLRARQLLSPIFLYRTLTYMRHRMSKKRRNSNKRRKDFKVNSIYETVLDKRKCEERAEESSGNLTLHFSGICDPNLNSENGQMTLEVTLIKMCHKKRKDVTAPMMQLPVGKCEVQINPKEAKEINSITISKSNFQNNNGHLVKSYSILFHASYSRSNMCGNGIQCALQENISNECSFEMPLHKKRKYQDDNYYKAELIIYDKHQRCLLTDAEYQVVLKECPPPKSITPFQRNNKVASWEAFSYEENDNFLYHNCKEYGPIEVFRNGPVLGFQLSWNRPALNPNAPSLSPVKKSAFSWFSNKSNQKDAEINDSAADNANAVQCKEIIPELSVNATKKPLRIIYQFLFNNNTRQQTKPRDDFYCPWCSLNCMNLHALLKHLKLCHGRFIFTYVPHPKGARIDVSINESYDGSYVGNPHDLSFSNIGFAFSRNGPVRRTPVTHVIVCRPQRFPTNLNEFLEPDDDVDGAVGRGFVSGHNRLYYHTNTCLPIRPQDMDYDSEAENDPIWMRVKTQLMIDEFTDVNEGEKEVMKLWNLHVMKRGFVGDCQIPLACMMFVEEKGFEIFEKNLYKNFILHLCNLFDFGLLNASAMIDIIKKLQKFQNKSMRIKNEPQDLS